MDLSFERLSDAEHEYISAQLSRARDFAAPFALPAGGGGPSLESLDRAFETYLASNNESDDADGVIQALGAALGSALVEKLGFTWVMATDERGAELAVLALPGRGDVTIFPVEFVAKRYDRRQAPFLVAALEEISRALREIAAEWSDSG